MDLAVAVSPRETAGGALSPETAARCKCHIPRARLRDLERTGTSIAGSLAALIIHSWQACAMKLASGRC
jgi:hypothetical protein